MSTTRLMRAVQLQVPGVPSNLKIVDLPIPQPQVGQVLIRVKAFGLNRSEILTRRFGRAPVGPVQLPRVLGVEAVGLVESAPGGEFPNGATVMTAIGGMGIFFDGGYAEYTCVSSANVRSVSTTLDWSTLGAIPEMMQTAHGTLFRSLKLQAKDKLLIRGGTSSIGLAAANLAKYHGAIVLATTRKTDESTHKLLKSNGVDHVIVGNDVKAQIEKVCGTVDKILDLVGGPTIPESMSCLSTGGICCSFGLVGGSPQTPDFSALAMIPTETYLTSYSERTFRPENFPLDDIVRLIEQGQLKVPISKVFRMEEIVQAHELMESNEANGKIVILTG